MTAETLDTADAIRLVLGVARLEENDLQGWWQGHAMNRTGRYVSATAQHSRTIRANWGYVRPEKRKVAVQLACN